MGFEPTKHNAADFVSENNELLLGKMFVIVVAVADLAILSLFLI